MGKKRKCWLWHRYRVVHHTGFSFYMECEKCGARKVEQLNGCYQPVDKKWLAGERDHIGDDLEW